MKILLLATTFLLLASCGELQTTKGVVLDVREKSETIIIYDLALKMTRPVNMEYYYCLTEFSDTTYWLRLDHNVHIGDTIHIRRHRNHRK